jgi:glycosyltransferase involved in cell wall biosynthesis
MIFQLFLILYYLTRNTFQHFKMENGISISIPTFNRPEWTVRAFEQVLYDDRVGEVCIVDDCSNIVEYSRLQDFVAGMDKVKLFRNPKNVDCYINKKRSVEKAENNWTILVDSDNVLEVDYLDRIFECAPWSPDTIYAPVFAAPNFDYRAFSGCTITKENVSSYVDRPMFLTAMNTANYLVHRETYWKCWDGSIDPITADTIFHNYNHLKSGGKIYFVPNLVYQHTVHPLSHYKQNAHRSGHLHMQIEHQLKSLR